jgi:hypothetical protein
MLSVHKFFFGVSFGISKNCYCLLLNSVVSFQNNSHLIKIWIFFGGG